MTVKHAHLQRSFDKRLSCSIQTARKIWKVDNGRTRRPKITLAQRPSFSKSQAANFRICYHNVRAKYTGASDGDFFPLSNNEVYCIKLTFLCSSSKTRENQKDEYGIYATWSISKTCERIKRWRRIYTLTFQYSVGLCYRKSFHTTLPHVYMERARDYYQTNYRRTRLTNWCRIWWYQNKGNWRRWRIGINRALTEDASWHTIYA